MEITVKTAQQLRLTPEEFESINEYKLIENPQIIIESKPNSNDI